MTQHRLPAISCAGRAALGLATAVSLTATAFVAPSYAAAPATPHISEIHYDNEGTDTGEAIEITLPPGTSSAGLSVVLYNGNGGAVYDTDAVPTATAPADASVAVVISYPTDGIQNGGPDGIALVGAAGNVLEFLSYEGAFAAVNGPASGTTSTDIGVAESSSTPVGYSLQRIDDEWAAPAPNTFPVIPEEPPAVCGDPEDPISLISDIQGSGATFDANCSGVQTVEAVVTAIKPTLSGFYLQEEAVDTDGDTTTSEGIFVFVGGAGIPQGLEVGQTVKVTAMVGEFTGSGSQQTQLTSPTVEILPGEAVTIEPTDVTFPVATTTTLEQYEGMLVKLVDTLVISEYFNYDRFGEVVLAKPLDGLNRLHTPTAVVEPGPEAQELFSEYDRRVITLDDYNSSQNPETIPHPGNGEPFSLDNTFRGGDTITGVEGVIDDTFGLYRIQPTTYGEYEAVNLRPTEAPEVGGSVQVASFNVLNYFLTLDTGAAVCGATQSQDCRGANSAEELERQRTKILAAMVKLDADVFGLMEMENTPGVEPAADLVAGLNDIFGAGTYDYIDTGVIGTDAIRLGFIYKPGVLTPVGNFEVLDSTDDPRFIDTANRPMLTQTFDEVATGERFTLSINHLKSKGSACVGDPDTGDGSGNCNGTRTAAAEAIVDFLATDPTGSGDPDHLVIGDLNSYDHEDPIDVLVNAGYTDLVKKYGGEHAYGYVFDGMVGYLDHALSNETLTPQVTGAAEWHINADEPDILDYNLDFGRSAAFYSPDMYRSSDHDPVLVGLELDGPVQDTTAPTLEVIADKTQIWPPNNKWVTVNTVVNAEDDVDETVTITLVDTTAEGRRAAIKKESDSEFEVRAVNGAVYTITYKATDDSGNTTTESVTVEVSKPAKEKRSR